MIEKLVSVIMPVYKAEKYVRKSIESVIKQTYSNIELICVDDASPDTSYDICKSLSKQHNQIRIIRNIDENGRVSNINLGQEVARNTGLKIAKGEYFLFLDSDDTLDADTIRIAVEKAEATNADLTMFTFSEMRNSREIPMLANLEDSSYDMFEFGKFLLSDIPWYIISCIGSKLYRTRIQQEYNILFDRKYKYNEDCAFALEYMICCQSVYYFDKPFYKYLMRDEDSTMSSYRPNMFNTNIQVVQLVGNIFDKFGLTEEKKDDFYLRIFYLAMDALINEKRFGNNQSFKNLVKEIKSYEHFNQIYNVVKKKYRIHNWQNIFISVLKSGIYSAVKNFLLLRGLIKNKNKIQSICIRVSDLYYRHIYSVVSKESDGRIYMFHNITDKETNIEKFETNYLDFEQFLLKEIKLREPTGIDKTLCCKNTFSLTFDDGYKGVFSFAYPIMKKYEVPFTLFITDEYIGKKNYFSRKELEIIAKDKLCTIGAHSISHIMLRFDPNSVREIVESKKLLEDYMDSKVDFFAYPYGSTYACSSKNIKCVRKAGYTYAFSTIEGTINFLSRRNPYFLPRINGDPIVMKEKRED